LFSLSKRYSSCPGLKVVAPYSANDAKVNKPTKKKQLPLFSIEKYKKNSKKKNLFFFFII